MGVDPADGATVELVLVIGTGALVDGGGVVLVVEVPARELFEPPHDAAASANAATTTEGPKSRRRCRRRVRGDSLMR